MLNGFWVEREEKHPTPWPPRPAFRKIAIGGLQDKRARRVYKKPSKSSRIAFKNDFDLKRKALYPFEGKIDLRGIFERLKRKADFHLVKHNLNICFKSIAKRRLASL